MLKLALALALIALCLVAVLGIWMAFELCWERFGEDRR